MHSASDEGGFLRRRFVLTSSRVKNRQNLVSSRWKFWQLIIEITVAFISFRLGCQWFHLQLEYSCQWQCIFSNQGERTSDAAPETTQDSAVGSLPPHARLGIPIQSSSTWNMLFTARNRAHSPNKQQEQVSKVEGTCQKNYQTIFMDSRDNKTCLAILPVKHNEYASTSSNLSPDLMLTMSRSKKHEFVPVSWYDDHGHKPPWRLGTPPKPVLIQQLWWPLLVNYLSVYHSSRQSLEALLSSTSRMSNGMRNGEITSWIVMVTNEHHINLLRNMNCAARHLKVDQSRILVVALDEISWKVSQNELKLLTFHPKSLVDSISTLKSTTPDYASRSYGTVMLVAKVHVVHLFSHLETSYDFLFQDVDVLPLDKDYHNHTRTRLLQAGADILFQYDWFTSGQQQQQQTPPEYGPWFVNSGYFYVRNNARTRYFFSSLVLNGDLVLRSNSHQGPLTWLLSQHVNRYQLKVHVLYDDIDADLYPGGYHFHHKWDYMRKILITKEIRPHVFHMNYNNNKETKQLFLEQMGWWFLNTGNNNNNNNNSLCPSCCIQDPRPKCHYRDKPSAINCHGFPSVETGISFW